MNECPDCEVSINGNSVAFTREIIDIPMPPAKTTLHVILKRKCWQCGKVCTPDVDFSHQVVGKSRFGINIVSLVSTLSEQLRQPVRGIQKYFKWVHQLHLSLGIIEEMRHKTAHRGAKNHRELKDQIRGAPMVNADETGFRENGVNRYMELFYSKS